MRLSILLLALLVLSAGLAGCVGSDAGKGGLKAASNDPGDAPADDPEPAPEPGPETPPEGSEPAPDPQNQSDGGDPGEQPPATPPVPPPKPEDYAYVQEGWVPLSIVPDTPAQTNPPFMVNLTMPVQPGALNASVRVAVSFLTPATPAPQDVAEITVEVVDPTAIVVASGSRTVADGDPRSNPAVVSLETTGLALPGDYLVRITIRGISAQETLGDKYSASLHVNY